MNDKDNLLEILRNNGDLNDVKPKSNTQLTELQFAEWLTELNEWKENPFLQIRTECRKNYYCNNCAFIDHCPFSNGNRVAAEYPMDWVVY